MRRKKTDELVDLGDVSAAALAVQAVGVAQAMELLAQREPFLTGFVDGVAQQIAGKMVLAGAPSELVQAVTGEMVQLVVTAVDAVQRGAYRNWIGLVPIDSPLAREFLLAPDPKKTPKRAKSGAAGGGVAGGDEGAAPNGRDSAPE